MFKFLTFISVLSSLLFCQYVSAQEEQATALKRTNITYKYHFMDDDSEKAKAFPQSGHSVQLGYNFCPDRFCEVFFFSFVLDYTHLRKYRDPHVLSAGFDLSIHPGKVFAKIWRKPYTPRMDKWLLTMGSYKTLDKYHLNYISSFDLSYRIRLGKVDLHPILGMVSFDETRLFSEPKPGERYMDFISFGLAARF